MSRAAVSKINGLDVRDATFGSCIAKSASSRRTRICFMRRSAAIFFMPGPMLATAEMQGRRCARRRSGPWSLACPRGWTRWWGERGYRFSGGEAAPFDRPAAAWLCPISILDEATAHLDLNRKPPSSRRLAVLKDRTSIVIAHRLSTILKADQILVVQRAGLPSAAPMRNCCGRVFSAADLYRFQFEGHSPTRIGVTPPRVRSTLAGRCS